MSKEGLRITRRRFLQGTGGLAVAASPLGAPFVIAQPATGETS